MTATGVDALPAETRAEMSAAGSEMLVRAAALEDRAELGLLARSVAADSQADEDALSARALVAADSLLMLSQIRRKTFEELVVRMRSVLEED